MNFVNGLFMEIHTITDELQRRKKLEEKLKLMEEELKKIEVFRKELPFCLVLLKEAIEALREEMLKCEPPKFPIVLEKLMPSKAIADSSKNKVDFDDKMNWMSSVQLWTSNNIDKGENNQCKEKLFQNHGGAFVPFKEISSVKSNQNKEVQRASLSGSLNVDLNSCSSSFQMTNSSEEDNAGVSPEPELSLASVIKNSISSTNVGKSNSPQPVNNPSISLVQQTSKKARRCWSSDLHRSFVNALQQIGGSEVATPKQIRELMKVDGLTNDEVKSHLQKYRLHLRKKTSDFSPSEKESFLILGRLWVPQKSHQSTKTCIARSISPSLPDPLDSENDARGASITCGESGIEDEDRKSESHSWKGNQPRSNEEETE